tara:strand:+ start:285 stop:449 length:165 start_codon:yes stop_codon:yes gene_type:complete
MKETYEDESGVWERIVRPDGRISERLIEPKKKKAAPKKKAAAKKSSDKNAGSKK